MNTLLTKLFGFDPQTMSVKKEVVNDWLFFAGSNLLAQGQNVGGGSGKAYFYFFDYVSEPLKQKGWGCCHACEVPIIFQTQADDMWSQTPEELELSHFFQTVWANFARTGVPSANCSLNGQSVNITWPLYTAENRDIVRISMNPAVEHDFRRERADLVSEMLLLSPKYHWSEFFTGIDMTK